jgi:hypothetical protein
LTTEPGCACLMASMARARASSCARTKITLAPQSRQAGAVHARCFAASSLGRMGVPIVRRLATGHRSQRMSKSCRTIQHARQASSVAARMSGRH